MKPKIIQGGVHKDDRGQLKHFNDFDLSAIKRVYIINPLKDQFRGWQAHQREGKWFYCSKGSIKIFLVKVDHWEKPSKDLEIEIHSLTADDPKVIVVPGGYASGFLATKSESELTVYSDFGLEESKSDDFRFDGDYWNINTNE